MAQTPLVIFVEGGIGVGKSTVIERLGAEFEDNPNVAILPEPVEEWTKHGFLEAMYTGEIDAGAFQHMALISITSQLLDVIAAKRPKVVIAERSPYSNRHVFGKSLSGNALRLFEYSWTKIVKRIEPLIDARFIYMSAPISTLSERISERSRSGEDAIPTAYLEMIDDHHEAWMKATPHKRVYAGVGADEVFQSVLCAVHELAGEAGRGKVFLDDEEEGAIAPQTRASKLGVCVA
jgi:deoxyadenosine/deoxycytidine kinase